MYYDNDEYAEIKRKIRDLKRLEIRIRFNNMKIPEQKLDLVWKDFFGAKKIEELASMSKDEYKNYINEFFINVYYRLYKENGFVSLYDPELLAKLELPFDTGSEGIKKKFRELAKKYHPDAGGDSDKFIEMLEAYKNLKDKNFKSRHDII